MGVWELVGAILGGGAASSVATFAFTRKKTKAETVTEEANARNLDADTVETLTGVAMGLIEPLQCRIDSQEDMLREQAGQIADQASRLAEQSVQIGTQSGRITDLEDAKRLSDSKLHVAVQYIADLRSWIKSKFPGTEPPSTPEMLKPDIEKHG